MIESARGRVWLVGAGPGDAGMMTVRGARLLRSADVIVHDRLIGPGVQEFFPEGARLIDVGKRVGNHPVSQGEIEEILIREASEGRRVVRLKGGDPFLFGRGGEEMLTLLANGIPCEVVPGVSSAVAVPACAGIPVTHRGLSAGVYITTPRRAAGRDELDYAHIAGLKDTVVLLMSAEEMPEIALRLTGAGMDPDTPAAVICSGTTARERWIAGSLGGLAQGGPGCSDLAPAVIVIGETVPLHYEICRLAPPLGGSRVWLTMAGRGDGLADRLGAMLREAGAEVIHAPCIKTVPRDVELDAGILRKFDWLVFSSRAGVENFFLQMRRNGVDIRTIGDAKIAAVGPSTRDELEARGLCVDFVPEESDGEHMARGLIDLGAGRVLLLRSSGVPCAWRDLLSGSGADVEEIGLYETEERASPIIGDCAPGDTVVFASASAVRVFVRRIGCGVFGARAVCIGRPTARAAEEAGFAPVLTAPRATGEALFGEILTSLASRRNES